MAAPVEVARRGQITIPKSMRESLGIEEGDKYGIRALEGARAAEHKGLAAKWQREYMLQE